MWPLTGAEVVTACAARTAPGALDGVTITGVTVGERPARPDDLFLALRDADHDGHDDVPRALDEGAALALVEAAWPGLADLPPAAARRCVVVPDPLAAFRALAAALRRRFSFPVVAVGGSNGKTTTKDLLAALLGGPGRAVTRTPETMNGDAGVPWTLCLADHARARPPDALVVEIGIDALGAMERHVAIVDPDVVILTALGVEHLDGLGSWEAGVAEELRLFAPRPGRRRVIAAGDPAIAAWLAGAGARAGDVIAAGDPAIAAWLAGAGATAGDVLVGDEAAIARAIAAIGARSPEDAAARGIEVVTYAATPRGLASEVAITRVAPGAAPSSATFHVALPGRHAAANFALAAATALALGRSMHDLAAGLAAFAPPPMRLAPIPLANGAILLDDTYNASPASVDAALDVVASFGARPVVVVLGDMLDLGAASAPLHRAIAPRLAALPGDARIALFGSEMRATLDALGDLGDRAAWSAADQDPTALVDALAGGRPWADALAGAVVLVKGSRGTRMERVVAAIVDRCGRAGDRGEAARVAALHAAIDTVAVTGTNGKTTTTSMIAAIVAASGQPSARVTTLGAWVDGALVAREPTTEAFLEAAERAVRAGVRTIAVETTSQALAAGFAARWPPRVAVFTNLTHDHLDVHGSPEAYLAAKAQLFLALAPGGVAVLDAADPASALLDEVIAGGVRRAGFAARPVDPACAALPIALAARAVEVARSGTRVLLAPSPLADALGGAIDLRPIGDVYAEDALAAAVAADAIGLAPAAIRAALAAFEGVPGRFEVVAARPLVVVDYAHTPDALARTLATARGLVEPGGRLACVFGCGGDRDPGKRGAMGRVAAGAADDVVVTTDNPRGEDPAAIADAVVAGAQGGPARVRRIVDRAAAIDATLAEAAPEDVVVIAGKGHETTQIGPDGERPFDDREVARAALGSGKARGR